MAQVDPWRSIEALDYDAKAVYLAAGHGGGRELDAGQIEKPFEIRRIRFARPGRDRLLDGPAE